MISNRIIHKNIWSIRLDKELADPFEICLLEWPANLKKKKTFEKEHKNGKNPYLRLHSLFYFNSETKQQTVNTQF